MNHKNMINKLIDHGAWMLLASALALFPQTSPTESLTQPMPSPSSGVFEQETGRSFLPPLMGWSSWNTYRVNISEELIKNQADALVRQGLKDVGYIYVNIDDGFFGGRDEQGQMTYHRERFPNGMKVVSDYIHSLGLKAGIYAEAGDNTCGSIYDDDKKGIGSGLYGHEQADMNLFLKDWNYDFIKIDYCGALELGLEEEQRYQTICDAIRQTGRTDVSINICRWAFPGTWAARLARSWRISPDITPHWNSVKNIIHKNLYLSAYAGEGHYNDMDMLEIGRGLKFNEEIVHFGMWCIMSSPLLIGCDLATIPEPSLRLLKNRELIALNQDVLGLQAHVVQHDGESYVLVKDIKRRRGRERAVALYNPSDTAHTFVISFETLGLGGKAAVRDVVNCKDLGILEERIEYTVEPHCVAIWTLKADRRVETSLYEAEQAYLPCYNDLGMNPKQVRYAVSSNCSGGIKVAYLGGRPENYAQWKDVYSDKGGEYKMTVAYCAERDCRLEVTVNGKKRIVSVKSSGGKDRVASIVLPIELKAGYNDIRMGNAYSWAPDIDCFTLTKE